MKRMKKFLKYLIILIALYYISNVLIDFLLYSNYENLEISKIQSENYNIKISEAKATNTNGVINGEISQKEDVKDTNKYMKIDFFNKRNELMGSEYLDISNVVRRRIKTIYYTV